MPSVPIDLGSDLEAERAHLAASRAALARMREQAQAAYARGQDVGADPFAAESLGVALARHIAELTDDPSAPLFFGRLSFGGPTVGEPSLAEFSTGDREIFHIGRRHVVDARGEPMVLDWRAPLSRAFYQASAADPQGVSVRRRFGWAYAPGAAVLTGMEDEHLDAGEELGTGSRVLTSEIERPRVGPMRDIVATIQPEQDTLVRADLDASICVQGAPGTGKTAVGLHRAAYLLFAHRERLRRSGVLLIGPNRAFLHYISAVLPALGEIDVTQVTVEDLLATVPAGTDTPRAAAVKHDARMAAVLSRALHGRIAKPAEAMEVPDGSYRWRISVDALRRIVDDVRREGVPYAVGRERVRSRVVSLLQRQSEARRADSPGEPWLRRMARHPQVTGFLDRVWPAVTPEALVAAVLTDPPAGVLDDAEREAIRWAKPPRTLKAARWTPADALLIDEAAGLIERQPGFGHIVIDEAQDLSPMQLRAVARRSEHASVTLLGDLAQGTAPWAARDWRDTLAHLGKPDAPVVPLTLGFRVPGAVLALANRMLPALAVDVPPARSLRHDGQLSVRRAADLAAATIEEVRAAMRIEGSIGVIAPDALAGTLAAALAAALAGVEVGGPDDDRRVSVLPATVAKGLEYDHVIAVEPAAIVAAEPRGLNRLYVVLTRAVSRLTIIHRDPLPEILASAH